MKKLIRFVDTNYNDKFLLPSGQCISIFSDYEVGSFVCTYVDDTHFAIGSKVYHIHEFAELCEKEGYKVCKKSLPIVSKDRQQKKYSYMDGSNGRVFITDDQAEEIYRQKEKNYRALDLKHIIDEEHSDDAKLQALTVDDLEGYIEKFESYLKLYEEDLDCYWNCCRTMIEDVISPTLNQK